MLRDSGFRLYRAIVDQVTKFLWNFKRRKRMWILTLLYLRIEMLFVDEPLIKSWPICLFPFLPKAGNVNVSSTSSSKKEDKSDKSDKTSGKESEEKTTKDEEEVTLSVRNLMVWTSICQMRNVLFFFCERNFQIVLNHFRQRSLLLRPAKTRRWWQSIKISCWHAPTSTWDTVDTLRPKTWYG